MEDELKEFNFEKAIRNPYSDENNKVIICKYCGQPEYWGEFRWLSGRMLCRCCYKTAYEKEYNEPYIWDDLEGEE